MNKASGISKYKAFFLCAFCSILSSCFTGIESTPRITHKELQKQHISDTPEKHILDDVVTSKPSSWQIGKQFYIADARALRTAWQAPLNLNVDSIVGETLVLQSIDTVVSITGKGDVQLVFHCTGIDDEVIFRTGVTPDRWKQLESYNLPHIIDLEMINNADRALRNKTFYFLNGRRIGHNGIDTIGTRYQLVTILDVEPNTEAVPLKINMLDNEGFLSSTTLTVGDSPSSRRNFETQFSIENPRNKYKQISDETWSNIIRSRVVLGMTPDECRLALGSPDSFRRIPTTGGMTEHWGFANGVYLIFEDGLLSAYRQ